VLGCLQRRPKPPSQRVTQPVRGVMQQHSIGAGTKKGLQQVTSPHTREALASSRSSILGRGPGHAAVKQPGMGANCSRQVTVQHDPWGFLTLQQVRLRGLWRGSEAVQVSPAAAYGSSSSSSWASIQACRMHTRAVRRRTAAATHQHSSPPPTSSRAAAAASSLQPLPAGATARRHSHLQPPFPPPPQQQQGSATPWSYKPGSTPGTAYTSSSVAQPCSIHRGAAVRPVLAVNISRSNTGLAGGGWFQCAAQSMKGWGGRGAGWLLLCCHSLQQQRGSARLASSTAFASKHPQQQMHSSCSWDCNMAATLKTPSPERSLLSNAMQEERRTHPAQQAPACCSDVST
jgi:hypothetical protein